MTIHKVTNWKVNPIFAANAFGKPWEAKFNSLRAFVNIHTCSFSDRFYHQQL